MPGQLQIWEQDGPKKNISMIYDSTAKTSYLKDMHKMEQTKGTSMGNI
jgi:hypothetical protein